MATYLRWKIPFVSRLGTQYCIDIYDEAESAFTPITLQPGDVPFTTDEDSSDDFFTPIRTQTGTIQICTRLSDGTLLDPADIMPSSDTQCPVLVSDLTNDKVVWAGALSCESYNQEYVGIPQMLDLSVNSVLEVARSIPISSSWTSEGANTVTSLIDDIVRYLDDTLFTQLSTVFSSVSDDILDKYIFTSKYFTFDTNDISGEVTYIYSAASIYEVLEEICKFMGWTLREQEGTLYFSRYCYDELGTTSANIADLDWVGTNHQRSISLGAKQVSVEAPVEKFETNLDMPECPTSGLTAKNYYSSRWYYDKCTKASVGKFTSEDLSKCYLARFYGISNDSSFKWEMRYFDLGFSNSIRMIGHVYSDDSYSRLCTITSAKPFSIVLGVRGTIEDVGFFKISVKEEISAANSYTGYIRCSVRFLSQYYSPTIGLWVSSEATFKVPITNGSGEIMFPLPKNNGYYTISSSDIVLTIYDDFDINGGTNAIISDINLTYEPPYKGGKEDISSNRYVQKLNASRDEVNIDLPFASSMNNVNGLTHIYEVHRYHYGGGEYIDYIEPITTINYATDDQGTTEARRPEKDLLDRLASYYGTTRTKLELEVEHPTTAPLPLLRLNGINDGKIYAPMSESRDWQMDTTKLVCMEIPQS